MLTYYTEDRSSNITEVSYDPLDGILQVLFKSGIKYEYVGYPANKLKDFIESDSLGKYFNNNIKDKFTTNKIGEAKPVTLEIKELIRNVEKHGFTCDAGPLEKCASWLKLKKILIGGL